MAGGGFSELIRQKLDFVGINCYTRNVVRARAQLPARRAGMVKQPQATYTETGWRCSPGGSPTCFAWFKRTYGDLPVYITENGAAFLDPRSPTTAAASATRCAPTTCAATCSPCTRRSAPAWTCAATWSGRCSTSMEWSLGYPGASASSTWTTPPAARFGDSARYYQRVVASHALRAGGGLRLSYVCSDAARRARSVR